MSQAFIFLFSAFLCAGLTYGVIYISKLFHSGQVVREEGPKSHLKKSGTPAMGGIAIILSLAAASGIFVDFDGLLTAVIIMAAAFAAIGLLDDALKSARKTNLGLLPQQKMALQILAALAFGTYAVWTGHEIWPAWFYLPFICFLMVGFSNAANLTDGLDGLLAGCAIVIFAVFYLISSAAGLEDIAGLCLIVSGTLAGFLVFNFNPAKIFMGDSGSLALGALIAGLAVLLHKELLLFVIAGVLLAEAFSVILQVAVFKLTGKRVFKMSPLHHHFELSGMSERNVVYMFWAASALLGAAAIWIF